MNDASFNIPSPSPSAPPSITEESFNPPSPSPTAPPAPGVPDSGAPSFTADDADSFLNENDPIPSPSPNDINRDSVITDPSDLPDLTD